MGCVGLRVALPDSEVGQREEFGDAQINVLGKVSAPCLHRKVARPEGVEPPTLGTEIRCSIQLSYGRPIKIKKNEKG